MADIPDPEDWQDLKPVPVTEEIWSVIQAAIQLNTSEATVHRVIHGASLTPLRTHNGVRFLSSDLNRVFHYGNKLHQEEL